MRLRVELELVDIYGGDGFTRAIKVQSKKLGRQRKEKRTRESIGVSVEDATSEERTEEKDDVVNTFKRSANGKCLLRLGGSHGKLWGALREAGRRLATFGDEDFKSMAAVDRMMGGISAWPVEVEMLGTPEECTLPQLLRGFGGMVIMRFDVLRRERVSMSIEFPASIEKHVRKMLKAVERGGNFNKRRTTLKVVSAVKESDEATT